MTNDTLSANQPAIGLYLIGGAPNESRPAPAASNSINQSQEPAYLVIFLQGPIHLGEVFWDHGEMGGVMLNSDFSIHTDLGTIHSPCADIPWKSGRLLAGNIVPGSTFSDGRREFHLFYGGSPGGDGLLQEELGLARFIIAPNGEFEWDDRQTVEIRGWEKYYDCSTHPSRNRNGILLNFRKCFGKIVVIGLFKVAVHLPATIFERLEFFT